MRDELALADKEDGKSHGGAREDEGAEERNAKPAETRPVDRHYASCNSVSDPRKPLAEEEPDSVSAELPG